MKKTLRLMMCLVVVAATGRAAAQRGVLNGEWHTYGGDAGHTKYSPLDQIHAGNVDKLRIAWRWVSIDEELKARAQGSNDPALKHLSISTYLHEATPLMVRGVLYTSTSYGQIAAIDARTGKTRWSYDPGFYKEGRPPQHGFLTRGLAYWTDGKAERLFWAGGLASMLSIDARTGKPDPHFGTNGSVDLTKGLPHAFNTRIFSVDSPPLVVRDVLVVGSIMPENIAASDVPQGHVRGFDVRTGQLKWTFHTIPQAGEFGNATWEGESWKTTGGVNVWTPMSADEELGFVYLPVGTPMNDFYGGKRLGDNLFSNSLVCVDARTGKRVWHFQFVRHPIWDYDPPAAPTLLDLRIDGRAVKAVAQITKQGFIFAFDRATGQPLWPIEERSVPPSSLPGERTAPTQPFPTKPPLFERFGVSRDDVIDFTPELKAEALAILEKFDYGPPYTAPTERGTIVKPGYSGGANWWGAAVDPDTGFLYVPSWAAFSLAAMRKQPPERDFVGYAPGRVGDAGLPCCLQGPRGLPLFKPPYSSITAYDMNRGEMLWTIPHGDGPRDHPDLRGLNLPKLGSLEKPGGPLLTKTLLFIGQGLVSAKFRAFDKRTGQQRWEFDLPARSSAAPITYMLDGKQYIVVAVGGGDQRDEFVAFSLP
ncbi:MAG: pyrroloquinoline quinone-dependent dehydrogenase [Acidobacteriota bacterium]